MVIDNKFEIGQTVYLATDPEQVKRVVYAFLVYRNEVLYKIAAGVQNSDHYDFELSTEPDQVLKTS